MAPQIVQIDRAAIIIFFYNTSTSILVYLLLISKYAQKAVARDPTTKLSKN